MLPLHTRRSAGLLIIALSMLLTLVVAAPVAAKKNPPGNNGTVKIDAAPWDNHPNNEPHVDCEFEVDFYGFDEGDLWAGVTFTAHPPTGHGVLLTDSVFIGHDDNSGGGSLAGWDASARYDLTDALAGFDAHPTQGYHVKLTVNADGSQGADTKHKVFWVGPCQTTVVPPSQPPGSNPPPSNPPGSNPPPSNPPASNPPGGIPPASNPPREDTAGGSGGPTVVMLPDTAMDAATTSLAMLGGLLIMGGSLVHVLAAVRRTNRR